MKKIIAVCLMVVFAATNVFASSAPLWSAQFKEAVKWTQVTKMGVLLAGSNSTLSGVNPEDGTVLWTRDDLKKTAPFNTKEVVGTPILLVNDYSGMGTKTRLYAVNLTDGKDVWSTQPEDGYAIGVFPVPSKNLAVLFYSGWDKTEGTGIYMRAYDLTSGKELWRKQFERGNNPIVLHVVDDFGMFYAKSDLSGHQEPIIEGDNMYVPFKGVHCIDLNTGDVKWEVPFKTAIPLYKKSYAPLVMDGDVIYASGYGVIYAVDKITGAIKWQSEKISSGQVAEVTVADEMLLARVGGFFYQPGGKTFVLDKPLQVVAYNKADGKKLWELRKIELGITNLLYIPQSKTVVLADGKGIIGLDATSAGKATEKFRVPLKFTRNIGTAEVASAGVKALTGGVGGLLHAGIGMAASGKARMDIPVSVSLNDDGTVAVRGKQHVMSFDPASAEIKWSNFFPAPGAGMLEVVAMTAVTAFSTVGYQASYAGGGMSADSASSGIKQSWGNFDRVAARRYEASKAAATQAYILTNVEDEGKKGLGIVAVNLKTGEPDKQFLFNDKKPTYSVDEIEGKLFYFKNKTTLEAYALK